MTYFPQPNPANPARRLKVSGSVDVAVRSDGAQPVRAKQHDLSATGGLLLLPKAFDAGDFVELALQTARGTVHGMAEILVAKRESPSGCLQPFRFVAMDDESHSRLCLALEYLTDPEVGIPSTKRRST